MDSYSIIQFLRYIQRVQVLVKASQEKDPKFRDIHRCAKLVYDISDRPETKKRELKHVRLDDRRM